MTGVVGVSLEDWLAYDYFFGWHSPCDDFLYRGLGSPSVGSSEKGGVGVVGGGSLIVKLDIVEVDGGPDGLVNTHVASVLIIFLLEIGSLRSVSDDMIGQSGSELSLECDNPGLPVAGIHGAIVFVVDVYSIEIVPQDEICQFVGAAQCINLRRSGQLRRSKRAYQYFYVVIIVLLLQILLNLIIRGSEH